VSLRLGVTCRSSVTTAGWVVPRAFFDMTIGETTDGHRQTDGRTDGPTSAATNAYLADSYVLQYN